MSLVGKCYIVPKRGIFKIVRNIGYRKYANCDLYQAENINRDFQYEYEDEILKNWKEVPSMPGEQLTLL
jgi:hypothetical protein